MIILKNLFLLISFFALLLNLVWFSNLNFKRINHGYEVITSTSIEQRKNKVFKRMHMYYDAVNTFTNKLKDDKSMPSLFYPQFNPGVNIHLDGYRHKFDNDFLIAVHVDRILINHDTSSLECAKTFYENKILITCNLPEKPFTITGLHFINLTKLETPFYVEIKNSNRVLWEGEVKEEDIIYSDSFLGCCTGGEIAAIIKFKNINKNIYNTFNDTDFETENKIKINVNKKDIGDINITGHLKSGLQKHYAIEWYLKDHWTYFAVVADSLDEAIKKINKKLNKF